MNNYWTEEEIFTGDQIENITDYRFDIDNFVKGNHGRIKINYNLSILVNKQIDEINKKQPQTIFVYGHDIEFFLNSLHRIKSSFVLITHNSDLGIFEKYSSYLKSNKIIKWYGQNNYINHPKVVTLPIGIARKKYPHGNISLLSQLSRNNKKTNLVYKNFDISTNPTERTLIQQITNQNSIPMSPRVALTDYWLNLSHAVFSISPPGNGVDCHRIWESLYLKTVPIVKYNNALGQFKHLPILFIDKWEDVTYNFLKERIDLVKQFRTKYDTLNFNYWKKRING